MNFKEALIAHLQGEKVECREKSQPNCSWSVFEDAFQSVCVAHVHRDSIGSSKEFRIAPRTILVNGVEVPVPEKVAPTRGATYYIPTPDTNELWLERCNQCEDITCRHIDRGLVYLDKESAIARAKAMLITQEVK